MLRCVLLGLMACTVTATAHAQLARPFPANALRGTLVVSQPPEVLVNGQPSRLSPGSRIRDPNNLLVLSGGLVGQQLLVNYTMEASGLVHNVWILNAEEAARRPWPTTLEQAQTWTFDAAAQVWTRR